MLVYGIPEFRLPKAIVQREVDYVGKLGAKIKVDTIVGQTATVDELFVGAMMPYSSVPAQACPILWRSPEKT